MTTYCTRCRLELTQDTQGRYRDGFGALVCGAGLHVPETRAERSTGQVRRFVRRDRQATNAFTPFGSMFDAFRFRRYEGFSR